VKYGIDSDKKIRVIGVILARMGSARFPGKAMSLIQGKSLIEIITDRVGQCTVFDIPLVLATTDTKVDDQLEAHAETIGIDVFRGSESNVLSRAVFAGMQLGATHILRLNGDCPLVEPELIDEALSELVKTNPEVVTSKRENQLPYGISVEIARLDLLNGLSQSASDFEKEHIFNALYNNVAQFKLSKVGSQFPARPDLQLTVDHPGDNIRIEALINSSGTNATKVKYWQIPYLDGL